MPLTFQFDTLEIDTVQLASQGNAVLGIRGSGKTMTATSFAEHLFEAGIPWTAFDPIGVWRYLRTPGTGRGYPVVVAGGQHGDLDLTPANAGDIMRAAMKGGVSIIFDLYDIHLSKADWRRIVQAAVEVMLYENGPHGLRHIFIEEAAEFIPQRPSGEQGGVFAAVEKLARMGGNSRLGFTLINQRSEEVAKSALELCDNLFLHRQKGRNSIQSLSKWLDVGNVREAKAVVDSISTLPTGECWAWMNSSEQPVLIHVPMKNSAHPDRTTMAADVGAQHATVDASTWVTAMKRQLAAIAAPPAKQKGIAIGGRQQGKAMAGELAAAKAEGHVSGYKKGHAEGMRTARAMLRGKCQAIIDWLDSADFEESFETPEETIVRGLAEGSLAKDADGALHAIPHAGVAIRVEATPPAKPLAAPRSNTGGAANKLLAAFAKVHPLRVTWGQAAAVAGRLKTSGGYFNTGRRRLLAEELATEDAKGRVGLTAKGIAASGIKPSDAPTIVIMASALDGGAARIFEVIRRARGIAWEAIAEQTGLMRSGGYWNTAVRTLRNNEMILECNDRVYVAGWLEKGRT